MARLTNQDLRARLYRRGLKELIANNDAFKRYLWTILNEAAIFATTHVPGSSDTSAFAEGRRALGLRMLEELKAAEPRIISVLWDAGADLDQEIQTAEQEERERAALPDDDE